MDNVSTGVPEHVEIMYREVGRTHVFVSKGIVGLIHIGSHNLEKAFRNVIPALSLHVKEAYGCDASYRCDRSFEEFSNDLGRSNDIGAHFLTLTREHKRRLYLI